MYGNIYESNNNNNTKEIMQQVQEGIQSLQAVQQMFKNLTQKNLIGVRWGGAIDKCFTDLIQKYKAALQMAQQQLSGSTTQSSATNMSLGFIK